MLFLMYHKWDNVPKMGHNFLPSSTPFSTSFFTSFFAFFSSNYDPSAAGLYPRWHIFGHPNVPKWHKIRWPIVPKKNRIDTFDDGLSSRSMTTTAAIHTFPEVLLGFLDVFPNKNPVRQGFLRGYLITFSDSHFGITGFTSFGHSISMTTSSDDVGRSATK